MRAVVEVEEDQKGATILVVTELPYQVNPDNLLDSIAQLVKDGKIAGIRAIHDESSDRIGMRIVVTLTPRRRGQGGAEQPVQAHAAADDLRRQHAGHRRRRAAHAAAGPVRQPLRRAPGRGHRPAHPLPAQGGRGARPHPARLPQGARPARRRHRVDPQLALGRGVQDRSDGSCSRSTSCRPTPSSTCSCGVSRRWSGSGSSTRPPRSRPRSPTCRTSWPSRAGSARSFATR